MAVKLIRPVRHVWYVLVARHYNNEVPQIQMKSIPNRPRLEEQLAAKGGSLLKFHPFWSWHRQIEVGFPLVSYGLTTVARYFNHIAGESRTQVARNSVEFIAKKSPASRNRQNRPISAVQLCGKR